MPISSPSGEHTSENSLYAPILEYAVMVLALDHFFREVVEGNVPLTQGETWYERQIVPERVNHYSRNWCVLFESLAALRQRIEEQSIRHAEVGIDENLNFTYQHRRRDVPERITWESSD